MRHAPKRLTSKASTTAARDALSIGPWKATPALFTSTSTSGVVLSSPTEESLVTSLVTSSAYRSATSRSRLHLPGGGDHMVTAGGQFRRKRASDAGRTAGDQHSGHASPLLAPGSPRALPPCP